MARKRANPPEKKATDREASDFALSRAERRRKLLRDGEGATLQSWETRQAAAKKAREEAPAKTIGERIAEQTFQFFRRWWSR